MNYALQMNFIPNFNNKLSNLNHLLFADDLIIVTKVSMTIAMACLLCLSITST